MSQPFKHEKPFACPRCGHKMDTTDTSGTSRPPRAEDATLCLSCGGILSFTEGMDVRLPTAKEERDVYGGESGDAVRTAQIHIAGRGPLEP